MIKKFESFKDQNKIPTSEEYAKSNYYGLEEHDEGGFLGINTEEYAKHLKSFAEIHVKAALLEASQKASLTDFAYEFLQEGASDAIDKESILNSYPLANI